MSVWFDPGPSVASAHPSPCPDPSYRVVNPLEISDWDARLARFPDATPFHTQGWARVLHRTYGFTPVYLVQQQDDVWTQLLPLMEVRSLFGSRRGVSLPFTDACPPLSFSLSSEREKAPEGRMRVSPLPAALSTLTPQLEALARSRHWTHLELRPGMPSDPAEPASVRYYNHVVALHADEATQLDACEPATRRSLRKAQSSGLRLTVDSDPANLDAYFRLHCLTRRRQGAPPQPMRFFTKLHQELLTRGMGFIVLAWKDTVAVAGAVFLHFQTRATYKFGASDLAHQALRPNQWVLWTGFRHATRLGCTQMDLGRTSLHHDGLRRFKRGWGAQETVQASFRFRLSTGDLVPVPDRTTGLQTALFQHLPLWVNRWMGNLLYRYAA